MSNPPKERLFSTFETWPDGVFYAPVVAYWIWLTLYYRGFLIMLTNPKMPLGGFTADLKSDWFVQLGPEGRTHTAPFAIIRSAAIADPALDLATALAAMHTAGLVFPIVAKPDLGKNGTGVQIVENTAELDRYLRNFPRATSLVLQMYIPYEGEVGVFYIRHPGEAKGHIVSLTLKYFPYVTGDGTSTLRQLIEADARARHIKQLYFVRHAARLDEVIADGERIRLVSVGNHCKGAIFKDGAAHITPEMEEAFDKIAQEMPEFYFGRFDVRYASLEGLKAGKDFMILEVNGPGSEMTHIWDADMPLMSAYKTLFGQYRVAWQIGNANRKRGYPLPPLSSLIRSWFDELDLLKTYTWEE